MSTPSLLGYITQESADTTILARFSLYISGGGGGGVGAAADFGK